MIDELRRAMREIKALGPRRVEPEIRILVGDLDQFSAAMNWCQRDAPVSPRGFDYMTFNGVSVLQHPYVPAHMVAMMRGDKLIWLGSLRNLRAETDTHQPTSADTDLQDQAATPENIEKP